MLGVPREVAASRVVQYQDTELEHRHLLQLPEEQLVLSTLAVLVLTDPLAIQAPLLVVTMVEEAVMEKVLGVVVTLHLSVLLVLSWSCLAVVEAVTVRTTTLAAMRGKPALMAMVAPLTMEEEAHRVLEELRKVVELLVRR